MDLYLTNFGLSGQIEGYDSFIFCGRKCKKRKEERHKAKMEKRLLKNDAKRAETERLRTETELMKKEFESPTPTPVSIQREPIKQANPKPYYMPQNVAPPVQKSKTNYLIPIIIVGLLGLGGTALLLNKKMS
jgi:hypothetical protein